jgi:hypothetical protein
MKGSTRSIAGLMTLVALAAVSIAALRASDALAAVLMLALDLGAIVVALVVAISGDRSRRPFALGFAVACGLVLIVTEWPATRDRLPATPFIRWLHDRLVDRRMRMELLPRDSFDESFSAWSEQHPDVVAIPVGVYNDSFVIQWDLPTLDQFTRIARRVLALFLGIASGTLIRLFALLRAPSEVSRPPIPPGSPS